MLTFLCVATATLTAIGCGDTGHGVTSEEYLRDHPPVRPRDLPPPIDDGIGNVRFTVGGPTVKQVETFRAARKRLEAKADTERPVGALHQTKQPVKHVVTSTTIRIDHIGRTSLLPPVTSWIIVFRVDPPVQPGEQVFLPYGFGFSSGGHDTQLPETATVVAHHDDCPCAGCSPFIETYDGRLGSMISPEKEPVDGVSVGLMTRDTESRLQWVGV
jgi:hypothetical protein